MQLGQHFMKPRDSEDFSSIRILHFIQDAELLDSWI